MNRCQDNENNVINMKIQIHRIDCGNTDLVFCSVDNTELGVVMKI